MYSSSSGWLAFKTLLPAHLLGQLSKNKSKRVYFILYSIKSTYAKRIKVNSLFFLQKLRSLIRYQCIEFTNKNVLRYN